MGKLAKKTLLQQIFYLPRLLSLFCIQGVPQGKDTEPISSCIPPARPGPTPRPTALPVALAPPARTPLLLPLARAGGVRFVAGVVGRAGGLEEGDLVPRVERGAARPGRLSPQPRLPDWRDEAAAA